MSCSSSSASEEEDEGFDSYRKGGYHAVRVADTFAGGRYVAQRKLGWGQFSTVWLAYDTQNSSYDKAEERLDTDNKKITQTMNAFKLHIANIQWHALSTSLLEVELPDLVENYVALKIQKSAPEFAQSALHEIEVLSAIADGDPSNSKYVVRLIDHFKHVGPNGQHWCMVLEFLGDSILGLIRYNRYKGLEFNKVREICRCILTSLDYLHRELGIIHTDLKPENILLLSTINPSRDPTKSGMSPILEKPEGNPNGSVTMSSIEKKLKQRARRAVAKISNRRSSVGGFVSAPKPARCLDGIDMRCKIVDFGNACWDSKKFAEEIQTRQYRAPEVILQSGYSFSADMWSFGCTAFELVTGEMMLAPKGAQGFSEDEDHLALMMELLGKMPRKIAIGGLRSKEYFDRHGDLKRIRRLKFCSLERLLVEKFKVADKDAHEFTEFLCPILDFAPDKRPTAQQCLQHPWLSMSSDDNSEST